MDFTKKIQGTDLSQVSKYQHPSGGFHTGQSLLSPDVRVRSAPYSQGESREFGVNILERNVSHNYISPNVDVDVDVDADDLSLREYERLNKYNEYFHLLESLWRNNGVVHKNKPVTPDFILTEINRFSDKQELTKVGYIHRNKIERLRLNFLKEFYFSGAVVEGRKLTVESVINAYTNRIQFTSLIAAGYSHFLFECFKKQIVAQVDGGPITAEKIVHTLPMEEYRLCRLAEYKAYFCLNEVNLYGKAIEVSEVMDLFDKSVHSHPKAPLYKALFVQNAFLNDMFLNGQKITFGMVCELFDVVSTKEAAEAKKSFISECEKRNSINAKRASNEGEALSELNTEKSLPTLWGCKPKRQPNQSKYESLRACASQGLTQSSTENTCLFSPHEDGRTLEYCFHRGERWNNSVVTTARVLDCYERFNQLVQYLNFLQSLWCNKNIHNGNRVTPDFILGEIVRFKNEKKVLIKGVPAGKVLENCRLRFLQDYYISGAEVGQKKLTAQCVMSAFGNYKLLDIHSARTFSSFLLHCFEHHIALKVDGGPITAEKIVEYCPNDTRSLCRLAEIKGYLCLNGICLNGKPVEVGEVISIYNRSGYGKAPLYKARFLQDALTNDILLNGKPIDPDWVYKAFDDLKSTKGRLARACFIQVLYKKELPLAGKNITPEAVYREFNKLPKDVGLGALFRCKLDFCLAGKTLNGNKLEPGTVLNELRELQSEHPSTQWIFLIELYKKGMMLNGNKIDPMELIEGIRASDCSDKEVIEVRFWQFLCESGAKIKDKPIDFEGVFEKFSLTENMMVKQVLAHFKKDLWLDGREITATEVVSSFREVDNLNAQLGLAHMLEECFHKKILVDDKKVSLQDVLAAFDVVQSRNGQLGKLWFMNNLCIRGIKNKREEITPREFIDFANRLNCKDALISIANFIKELFLRGMVLDGKQINEEAVIEACRKASSYKGKICEAMFLKALCVRGMRFKNKFVSVKEVLGAFPKGAEFEKADFLRTCYEEGICDDGKTVTLEEVVVAFDAVKSEEGQISKAKILAKSYLFKVALNEKKITLNMVVDAFPQSDMGQIEKLSFMKNLNMRGLRVRGQVMTFDQIFQELNKHPGSLLERLKLQEDVYFRSEKLCGEWATPEEIRRGYQRGGFFYQDALFCRKLALRSITCEGAYLSDNDVLAAFDKVIDNDTTIHQIDFLLRRLKIELFLFFNTEQVFSLWKRAWGIVDSLKTNDNIHHHLKGLLMLTALQCELPVENQVVTVEQVDQELQQVRRVWSGRYLYFYFLLFCNRKGYQLKGKPVDESTVRESLEAFPRQSVFQNILEHWFQKDSHDQNKKRVALDIRREPSSV